VREAILNITPFLDESRFGLCEMHHPIFGIFKDREGCNPAIKTTAERVQKLDLLLILVLDVLWIR
jgi:hypothetical protein